MIDEQKYIQMAFYIISPIVTFLAVAIAYLAIYKQSKPNVVVHYEPSNDVGSVIDLVICNYGGGSARDLEFSVAIPINCWGIEKPNTVDKSSFLKIKIPLLAPGKALRYQAGQYSGLLSQISETLAVTVSYKYRTPLHVEKKGRDISILDIKYMINMHSGNSPAYDLADAMKGRNNTVFLKTNEQLKTINEQLSRIASVLEDNNIGKIRKSRDVELSEPAKEILKAAASDKNGTIHRRHTFSNKSIQAGSKSFGNASRRECAAYDSALSVLTASGYVKFVGSTGTVFELTHEGWELADTF